MKIHQLVRIDNGTAIYNTARVKEILKNLDDGTYLITAQRIEPKAEIEDYRACYFAKLDILKDEVGETKEDLHEIVKEYILASILNEVKEASINPPEILSTKYLTLIGWRILLERLDLWAFTEYNVILP